MTFDDLKREAVRYVGLISPTDDPSVATWVGSVIQNVHQALSTMLRIPRKYVEVQTGTSNPLQFATDDQSGGLLAVTDKSRNVPLPFFDHTRALTEYGDYIGKAGVPKVVIYEQEAPGNVEVWPLPSTPTTLSFYYAYVPPKLTLPSDEPFDGKYAEYHHVIAIGAAVELAEADWADKDKVAWLKKRFDEELVRMVNNIVPGYRAHILQPGEV